MSIKEYRKIVETKCIELSEEFYLESGKKLSSIEIAYETYGDLNEKKDNVIFIFHALSGDAHVCGWHKDAKKPGWWDIAVGEEKAIDTKKFFVICANVIGGCKGTTGPNSINPKTKKEYGSEFPIITIKDMVKVHKVFLEKLGINHIHAGIGGSMGGMQALQFAALYPDFADLIIPIATSVSQPAQGIAFNEVGRQAILKDPNWNNGDYYSSKKKPDAGLSIARMLAHITYVSEESLKEKFGRRLQDKKSIEYSFQTEFQIESYLKYQGKSFVDRFDANSYLYITRAMDYFDLGTGEELRKKFENSKARWFVISINTDWLYPTSQSKEIVNALRKNHLDVSFFELNNNAGHDSFLIEDETILKILKSFLENDYEKRH